MNDKHADMDCEASRLERIITRIDSANRTWRLPCRCVVVVGAAQLSLCTDINRPEHRQKLNGLPNGVLAGAAACDGRKLLA